MNREEELKMDAEEGETTSFISWLRKYGNGVCQNDGCL